MSIRYHEAEDELLNEIAYLEDRVGGLGRRFLLEVIRTESFIKQLPEGAPIIRGGIRSRPLRKFRHSLIYSLEKDEIFILAVAHHRRHPEYWIDRLEDIE
jgi:hypothetical protein